MVSKVQKAPQVNHIQPAGSSKKPNQTPPPASKPNASESEIANKKQEKKTSGDAMRHKVNTAAKSTGTNAAQTLHSQQKTAANVTATDPKQAVGSPPARAARAATSDTATNSTSGTSVAQKSAAARASNVTTNGKVHDVYNGDSAALKQTIQNAKAGDTVRVHKGDYYEFGDAHLNKQINIEAAAGDKGKVNLLGSRNVSNQWTKDAGTSKPGTDVWRLDNWQTAPETNSNTRDNPTALNSAFRTVQQLYPGDIRTQNPGKGLSKFVDPKHPQANLRDQLFVNGQPLKQVTDKNQLTANKFYVDNTANQVYVGAKPGTDFNNQKVEATSQEIGLRVAPGGAATKIEGLNFKQYAGSGAVVQADRVVIQGNKFSQNGEQGLNVAGFVSNNGIAAKQAANYVDKVVVKNNTMSDNGRKGFMASKAQNLTLDGNIISNNNKFEPFAPEWDAAGAKILQTKGVTATNNTVESNDAHGLWFDVSVEDATVANNSIRNNTQAGVHFELSKGAEIAGNVFKENGAGVLVSGSSNVNVTNNSMIANKGATVIIKDDARKNNLPANSGLTQAQINAEKERGVDWETRNVRVTNNIVWDSSNGRPLLRAEQDGDLNDMVSEIKGNLFYHSGDANSTKFEWKPRFNSDGKNGEYKTLDEFKANTPFKSAGKEIIGETAPEQIFQNPAAGDYRLKTSLPNQYLVSPVSLSQKTAKALDQTASLTPSQIGVLNQRVGATTNTAAPLSKPVQSAPVKLPVALPPTNPVSAVNGFDLYSSDTDQRIGSVSNGAVINLSNTPKFNIAADLKNDASGSVFFRLKNANGGQVVIEKTENNALYMIGPNGTKTGGAPDIKQLDLPVGSYTLEAIPYAADSRGGTAGTGQTINFEVVNG